MKKKKLLQFGKKDASTNLENSPQESLQSNTFYRSIIDLPLRNFITCAVDNNLYALIITGKPSDLELQLAWEDIQQEYSDAIGDSEGKLYLSLMKDIIIIDAKHQLIKKLAGHEEVDPVTFTITQPLGLLRLVYSEPLCKELNKLCLTSFKFDPLNEEKYLKELDRCINKSKTLIIQKTLKQHSLDALQKKFDAKEEQKPTRQFFMSMLITLSDYAKYQIHDNITVFDYCERLHRLNKYIEQMNKPNARH